MNASIIGTPTPATVYIIEIKLDDQERSMKNIRYVANRSETFDGAWLTHHESVSKFFRTEAAAVRYLKARGITYTYQIKPVPTFA